MERLEYKVYKKLKNKGYKVATAESCTGGLLVGKLINVSGASEIVDMSFVTYSNEAKMDLVGVNGDSLEKYGAVSEQVAKEMAEGAKRRAKCEVGLSTSGIAGPKGGTPTKVVGTVCFGISINDRTYTYTHVFKNISRQYVRNKSVKFILKKLLEIV